MNVDIIKDILKGDYGVPSKSCFTCSCHCYMIWCPLTYHPLVLHICVSGSGQHASDNGLLPIRRQAIIRTNAGLLSIEPSGTNFSEILIKIQNSSFTKRHLKISSAKWRPFCWGRDDLIMLMMGIVTSQCPLSREAELVILYLRSLF